MVLRFDGAMQAADGTSPHSAAWFVEPDQASGNRRGQKIARARGEDATSMRAVIVSTLFLVLFTTAIMFGGHAAIDPLLRMATGANRSEAVGDIVVPMPDGKFCRHMSFDNATSEMAEGDIEPCPEDILRGQFRRSSGRFTWGEQ
jgi:hypothetical protein